MRSSNSRTDDPGDEDPELSTSASGDSGGLRSRSTPPICAPSSDRAALAPDANVATEK